MQPKVHVKVLLPLLFFALPSTVLAQFSIATCGDRITTVQYIGAGDAVTVPGFINGVPVTKISSQTFANATNLTSITLPDTLTEIETGAFNGCSGLTSVTIPASVSYIGIRILEFKGAAFLNCGNLTNIAVDPANQSFSSLDGVLFNKRQDLLVEFPGGKGGSYVVPNTVSSIANRAINGCGALTSIILPAGLSYLDSGFSNCRALTNISVDPLNLVFRSLGGVLFSKDMRELVAYPGGRVGGYSVPQVVTSIDGAFSGCTNLASVIFPDHLASIGSWAFQGCSGLTSLTIPSSVTALGDHAFADCTGLTNVTVPVTVLVTGSEGAVFANCTGLTDVTFVNGVKTIKPGMLGGCTNLTTVTIPDSVTSIEGDAFNNCTALRSVTLPNSLKSIGDNTFSGCTALTSLTLPASVVGIGRLAFADCSSLTNITVDGLNPVFSSVDGVLFNKNHDTLIVFPGGLGGSYVVPESVTKVGNCSFWGCRGLVSVMISNSTTNIDNFAFQGCSSLANLVIPGSARRIGDMAFCDCTHLTSMSLGDGLEEIAPRAFLGCAELANVAIPNNVRLVGDAAFRDCYKLTSVTVGSGVTNIGGSPFSGCASLTNIAVDALNPTYISVDGVLFNKNRDTLLEYPGGKSGAYTVPDTVTTINGAFAACTALTSVTILNSVIQIGDGTFYGCVGLTNFVLPNSLISIGDQAFFGCTGLTSVTIPASVVSLGGRAFAGCSSLRSAYFKGNAPGSVGCDVFADSFSAVVYYLPGVTPWGPNLTGAPTALWNPAIRAADPGFGVGPHGFGFNIAGTPNIPLQVEASTNLATDAWMPLQKLTLTNGLVSFTDRQWTDYPIRFYRIRSP